MESVSDVNFILVYDKGSYLTHKNTSSTFIFSQNLFNIQKQKIEKLINLTFFTNTIEGNYYFQVELFYKITIRFKIDVFFLESASSEDSIKFSWF